MSNDPEQEEIRHWWRTSIINMAPGKIEFRDHPIQDLIGNLSFSEMIWLMVMGGKLNTEQAKLFEATLVASVDHGPQAPSIAAARMAATCGVKLNNIMATGVNMLGDIHGGAGEQCAELYYGIATYIDKGHSLEIATRKGLDDWIKTYGKIISGFGHRFHKSNDPRTPRLFSLVQKAAHNGAVTGRFVQIAQSIQAELIRQRRGRKISINIDGATAVIFCELGVPAPLSRGFFCLSRSVGVLAHGWEQMLQGGRNKGPMPPSFLPAYEPKNK